MNAKDVQSGGVRPLVNWRRAFFDTSTLVLGAIMVCAGAAVFLLHGRDVFFQTIGAESLLLITFTPKMFLAFMVAGFVSVLVSRKLVARWLGGKAGMKGAALATGVGAVTPGGPMVSFPLVAALSQAGASRASMIAYITSWEILGFQRIMIWELPLLGPGYAVLRILVSIPLPFMAAFFSLYLPFFKEEPKAKEPDRTDPQSERPQPADRPPENQGAAK